MYAYFVDQEESRQGSTHASALLFVGVSFCVVFLMAFIILGFMCYKSARKHQNRQVHSMKVEEASQHSSKKLSVGESYIKMNAYLMVAIFSAVLGMFQFGYNSGTINAP